MKPTSCAALLKELELLASTGLGVALIAPYLSALLCKIVGAEAGGLSWFSETGVPEGFYQRGSTREAELLFMNRYKELFAGPNEYTPFWSLRNQGRGIIHTGQASKAYLRSNTFNMLVKPSHCHFLMCVLVDLDGMPRLSGCFFREAKNPFSEADAQHLTLLIPVLRRAIGKRSNALQTHTASANCGYMLISADGERIEMIDGPADQMLATIKLFDQNITLISQLASPPLFVQLLCGQLRQQSVTSAKTEIDLAGGTLVVSANWLAAGPAAMHAVQAMPSASLPPGKILVTLQFKQSGAIEVVCAIASMGLSPLQSQIAMYAAAGGSRAECALHHRVSKEAMKKHLREIFSASRCTDWQELSATLRVAPGTQ